MSDKQVLLVDDQREVRKMLRATLEVAIGDIQVADVPSAEEAMLEVQRTAFDLVVTDLDLPGMNGIELMARVRRSRPDARLIVVTGKQDARESREISALNPDAVFVKPTNPGEFIEAVERALGMLTGETLVVEVHPGVTQRVLALRSDLGAAAVYLADVDGHVVVRAGDVPELDVEGMIFHIEAAFSAAFRVSTMLGGYVPLNMQFFDGDEFDVYVANVGKSYMLLMIFHGDRGSQQMGSALHYGRQAADDLLNLLAQMGVPQTGPLQPTADLAPEPEPEIAEPAAAEAGPEDETVIEPIELDMDVLDGIATRTRDVNVDDFWDAALSETEVDNLDSKSISYDQALKLGLVPTEDE